MSRETQNALLMLVGVSIGLVAFTGSYTRYVKPSMLPWLLVAAVLLIALAVVAIVGDIRRGSGDGPPGDGHAHRSGVAWLLVVPVVLLAFVVPPAVTPRPGDPAMAAVSTDVARRPFPPLPQERAPALSLPELLMRLAQDSAGTLDGRLITVTGFTMKEDGRTDLARVVIICCAADAQLARIRLSGPAARQASEYPQNSWLAVEGKVPAAQGNSMGETIPILDVYRVRRIDPPARPYAY